LNKNRFTKQGSIVVNYLIGAFLLFKYDVLKENGFFDENLFLFYEEKDLELRLIKSGYELILQSDFYVEHLKSASSGTSTQIYFLRNWHVAWSNLYYLYKHNIITNKLSGYTLLFKYGLKYLINRGRKRIKYKARFFGAISYMKGESSFDGKGNGRYAPSTQKEDKTTP
jgi:N-acetylglucosaminyl-diphospho-decaprenol L-rhamnosyltransferase